jgi:molybdopterin converting factor small subunit
MKEKAMQDDAPSHDVSIVAFGPVSELVGEDQTLPLAFPLSGAQLRAAACDRWPQLAQQRFSIAVDQTLVGDEQIVSSGSELALLPPFAGG